MQLRTPSPFLYPLQQLLQAASLGENATPLRTCHFGTMDPKGDTDALGDLDTGLKTCVLGSSLFRERRALEEWFPNQAARHQKPLGEIYNNACPALPFPILISRVWIHKCGFFKSSPGDSGNLAARFRAPLT